MQDKNTSVSTKIRVSCLCHPEVGSETPTRRNNNLIKFLQSFIILPVIAVSVPTIGLLGVVNTDINASSQVALSPQQSIEANSLLAYNQAKKEKNEILKKEAEAIDAYFKKYHMPLKGTGMKFAQEADKNDLDWRLLPAIAVIETTGGKNLCEGLDEENNKNPFGWGSCRIGFNSFDQAIEVIAMNLSGNNPKTAHHYDGKTTKQILEKYNPPSIKPGYASKVMRVMDDIGDEDITPDTIQTVVVVANT